MAQRPRTDLGVILGALALAVALLPGSALAAPSGDAVTPAEASPTIEKDAATAARRHGRSLAMTSGYYLACGRNGLVEMDGDVLHALGVMSVLYLDLVDEQPDSWSLQGAKGYLLRNAAAGSEAGYVPITAHSCLELARKAEAYVGLLRDKLFPTKP